jgi:alkylation response protein AidB-like acyl-CoA dehydrogenase
MSIQLDTNDITLTSAILASIASSAGALDSGEKGTRDNIGCLAEAGLLAVGAPLNKGGDLPAMAAVIGGLAGECMSTAFSVWAHRMTIEYLAVAATPWAVDALADLVSGRVLGVTGMASAFKDAAGCGTLDLTAVPVEGGYELSGSLQWASNLHGDSLMVTAARTDSGDKIIVALPLSADGVRIGDHFDLLALGSTASSYLTVDRVRITEQQVLTRDFEAFLSRVRPTFLVLQSAMCLGLARRCLDQARLGLTGVNAVFVPEVDMLAGRLALAESTLSALASAACGPATPGKRELLSLRLTAAELASSAAALEVRTAGGKGYARHTDASRRFREAAFIPVQSPSESQLRWELSGCA